MIPMSTFPPRPHHDIYSDDIDKVEQIVAEIEKKWEIRFANGRMKK